MKYNILLLISFVLMRPMYSMESDSLPFTMVTIEKGYPYNLDGKVDIIVVGVKEQQRLNRTFCPKNIKHVGDIKFLKKKFAYINIIKKDCDSDSIEDKDNPCEIIKQRDYNFHTKKIDQSYVMAVIEPKIYNIDYGRKIENYRYSNTSAYFEGKEALEQAKKDLELCYTTLLQKGVNKLGNKQNKSIAIPLLGTAIGFPRDEAVKIACIAIFNFICSNPAYSQIILSVKKKCEYNWCIHIFEYITQQQKDLVSQQ